MDTLKHYKGTISALLLLAGLYFAYVQFVQGTDSDPAASLISSLDAGVEGVIAGQEIVALLAEIETIKLDVSLFESERFTSRVDGRKAIIGESVGRTNPFQPIGVGVDVQGALAEPNKDSFQIIGTYNDEVYNNDEVQ